MDRLTMYTPDGYESINPVDLQLDEYSDINFERLVDKLGEYEDAEEQGLIWKMPCKVGDYVYQIDRMYGKVNTRKVAKIELEIWGENKYTMHIWFETAGSCFSSHFGKTVFLNKPEATQALEKYLKKVKP